MLLWIGTLLSSVCKQQAQGMSTSTQRASTGQKTNAGDSPFGKKN
jgi:hypothetical protein